MPAAQRRPPARADTEGTGGPRAHGHGQSQAGIADALVITVRTVEKYVSALFGKLGIRGTDGESRRVLAVLLFLLL